MKKHYQNTIEETLTQVQSSTAGLTSKEAIQRMETNGKNVLKEKSKKSPFKIFISQFQNMMILLLILVGIVSLVYSIVTHESVIEAIVIFACVLVNALMGFAQELKSENAIEALKDLTVSKVQVKRDGAWVEIDATELVTGDIIMLEAGDKIPADARVMKAIQAKVDESILTGESIAVEKTEQAIAKNVMRQDQTNMVFSGTVLVNVKI